MNLWAILKIAIRALTRNKMRSALTMLGIIIGVGAVIAMVSIGQGAQSMIQTQIGSMGSNMLFVQPGNVRTGGVSQGLGAASTLTEDDVLAMEREIPTIALASPLPISPRDCSWRLEFWLASINFKLPDRVTSLTSRCSIACCR